MSLFLQTPALAAQAPLSNGNSQNQPPQNAIFLASSASLKNSSTLPSTAYKNASTDKILRDLLESANGLPKLGQGNIESINLTLNDLQTTTRQLRSQEKENGNFTQAHYLMTKSGINAADLAKELDSLPKALAAQFTAPQTLAPTPDMENYLLAKKEETILSSIEQSLVTASHDFDTFINDNVSIDWKVGKEKLKKSLGIPVKGKISAEQLAKALSWNSNLSGNYRLLSPMVTKTAAKSRQMSREKFEAHATAIYNLNEARSDSSAFPICSSLEELNKFNTDLKLKQMCEVWRILASLCNEKFAKINQEQLFHAGYQQPAIEKNLKMKILSTSRSYLEQQFFNYVDEIYVKEQASGTENPTNIGKVSFFINKVISQNNDASFMDKTMSINGVPIWALIFYLMRSGLYAEAVELTTSNKHAFEKFDKNFPIYLSHFVKQDGFGLPSELQERISSDFAQTFQFLDENSPNFDPYKYCVYKIIGKCDLVKKSLPRVVNLSIEDWLWFHMLVVNEFSTASASSLLYENYTLASLQKKVLSLGPGNFNALSSNPSYIKALVMLGMYELAVQFAYEEISECDAVHLAISLNYYGLLRVSTTDTDALISNGPQETFEINFGRLVGSFTRTFKISDPKVAAQYLILLCLSRGGKDTAETNRCHESLRELVLLSREFNLLLGELDPVSGGKNPGILEAQRALINLPELPKFYFQITEGCAVRCEEEGRVFDAVRLYQLCQDYDTVISLVNKHLSELIVACALDQPLSSNKEYTSASGEVKPEETPENNIVLLSKHLFSVLKNNSRILESILTKQKNIMLHLLPAVDIRKLFCDKDWQGTLDLIKSHGLVPIIYTDDFAEVKKAADWLQSLDQTLVAVVPSLLVISMTCVTQLYHGLLGRKYGMAAQEKESLMKLKRAAKNCMVFAGMIQYRMPRETYSLLVSLEAQL